MDADKIALKIESVTIKKGESDIIQNLSLTIKKGETIALMGISGCGKTTLLDAISNICPASSGNISVKGKIGYIFQEEKLLPWKTLYQQLELCEKIKGKKQNETKKHISKITQLVNLSESLTKYPHELSGGMKQRAQIAKLLASQKNIWLLDELTSKLDIQNKFTIQTLIKLISEQESITSLLVTHDIDEALFLADKIIILGNKPATILKIILNRNKPKEIEELTKKKFIEKKKEIVKTLQEQFSLNLNQALSLTPNTAQDKSTQMLFKCKQNTYYHG